VSITLNIAGLDEIEPLPGREALGRYDEWKAQCGDTLPTGNGRGMVVHRLDVDPHSGYCKALVVTGDGLGHDDSAWHSGPEAPNPVYVERMNGATGQVLFHGWIDPVSRRLVQSG
jgi:hypothetical protein